MIRLGMMRRSRSVTVTATRTAHPAAPTTASTDDSEDGDAERPRARSRRRRRWRAAAPGRIHRGPPRSSPPMRGTGFPPKGGEAGPIVHDDPRTAEHAPAPGVGAREIERTLGIPRTARAARHWLLWPATAVLVIGIWWDRGARPEPARSAGRRVRDRHDAGRIRRSGEHAPRHAPAGRPATRPA